MRNQGISLSEKEIEWIEFMMNLTKTISEKSPCVRRKVGCVITNNKNRIISCGFNGNIPGHPHCTKETCLRTLYNIPSGTDHGFGNCVHAEANAIISAAITGTSLINSFVYITTMPCMTCLKMLLSIQPERIIFESTYNYDEIKYIINNEHKCKIYQCQFKDKKLDQYKLLNVM